MAKSAYDLKRKKKVRCIKETHQALQVGEATRHHDTVLLCEIDLTIFFPHNIEKESLREEKENRKDIWDIDAAEEVERIERVQLKEAQSPERSGPDDEHIEDEASGEPGEGLGLDPSQRKRPAYEEMSFWEQKHGSKVNRLCRENQQLRAKLAKE
jgi:hypothetical protein